MVPSHCGRTRDALVLLRNFRCRKTRRFAFGGRDSLGPVRFGGADGGSIGGADGPLVYLAWIWRGTTNIWFDGSGDLSAQSRVPEGVVVTGVHFVSQRYC